VTAWLAVASPDGRCTSASAGAPGGDFVLVAELDAFVEGAPVLTDHNAGPSTS
jgi:hypothetical protein